MPVTEGHRIDIFLQKGLELDVFKNWDPNKDLCSKNVNCRDKPKSWLSAMYSNLYDYKYLSIESISFAEFSWLKLSI